MQKLKIEDVQEILNHLDKGVEIGQVLEVAKSSGEYKFTDDDCFSLRVCKDLTAPYWEFCIHFKEHQVYFAVCGDTISQAIDNFNFELKRVLKVNTDADATVVEVFVTNYILKQRKKALLRQLHNPQPLFAVKPAPAKHKPIQTWFQQIKKFHQQQITWVVVLKKANKILHEVEENIELLQENIKINRKEQRHQVLHPAFSGLVVTNTEAFLTITHTHLQESEGLSIKLDEGSLLGCIRTEQSHIKQILKVFKEISEKTFELMYLD